MALNLTSSSTSVSPTIYKSNDDEAEIRDRRRSLIVEMQCRTLNSPIAPAEKRENTPLTTFTNAELADHYTNCIKLSTENKINSKNAFALHLIDYMSEMLKKKDMNNFQFASSTLDASAKIYAGRVDAIHSETFKVLTGLGRSADQEDKNEDDGGLASNGEEKVKEPKKRNTRKSKTVVTNVKTLNVNKVEMEYEVEPLLGQLSLGADDPTCGGLLHTQLRCLDDDSEVVIDSSSVLPTCNKPPHLNEHQADLHVADLSDFEGCDADVMPLQICKYLEDFQFGQWDAAAAIAAKQAIEDQRHAFDVNSETTTVHSSNVTVVHDDNSVAGHLDEQPEDFSQVDDDVNDASGDDLVDRVTVPSTVSMIHLADLGNKLDIKADYSKTSKHLLCLKKAKGSILKEKKVFKLDFVSKDYDTFFQKSRAATTLSKATLDLYEKDSLNTTLPKDLHYGAECMHQIFSKSKVVVKDASTETDANVDTIINSVYDYNKPADTDNYCTQEIPGGIDSDDNDDDGMGGNSFENEHSNYAEGNLLEPPRKIARIDIAYAKTAKRMDVRRLKNTMWSILEPDNEDRGPDGERPDKRPCLELELPKFSQLLDKLPEQLPRPMTENLSVPIAFVCLLHLANEKNLIISSAEDMTDIFISKKRDN